MQWLCSAFRPMSCGGPYGVFVLIFTFLSSFILCQEKKKKRQLQAPRRKSLEMSRGGWSTSALLQQIPIASASMLRQRSRRRARRGGSCGDGGDRPRADSPLARGVPRTALRRLEAREASSASCRYRAAWGGRGGIPGWARPPVHQCPAPDPAGSPGTRSIDSSCRRRGRPTPFGR